MKKYTLEKERKVNSTLSNFIINKIDNNEKIELNDNKMLEDVVSYYKKNSRAKNKYKKPSRIKKNFIRKIIFFKLNKFI